MKISAFRHLAIFVMLAMLTACGTNPVTGKTELNLVSEKQEIEIGKKNYLPAQQSQGGQYSVDKGLTEYVNQVGQSLARVSDRPDLPYEFVVLNNGVPNAWALPGGKIAVNRGLLLELRNEAELAAVLGHEIVHAAARHGAKSMERNLVLQVGLIGIGSSVGDDSNRDLVLGAANVGAALVSKKYGRDAELESDHYGMKYMAKAGYDPMAAVSLQETFVRLSKDRKPNWLEGLFASHPPSQERVDANRKYAKQLGTGGELRQAEYQARIAHLVETRPAYEAYEKGEKALQKKNPDKALEYAQQAIDIEPREAMFYSLQGEAWLQKNDQQKAEESFNQAVKYNSDYFLPYLQRGLVRSNLGNETGAMQDLQRSAALLPTAPAYLGMGDLALGARDEDAAIEYYRQASASGSITGQQAGVRLATLDLPRHPERYISLGASQGFLGTVLITVQNRSSVSINRISIQAGFINTLGQAMTENSFLIKETLEPGKSLTFDTGLLKPALITTSFHARVRGAEVVQ